ncbi:MAG: hypothetical protein Q9178_003019 [Gyalolechia marmorata]
MAFTRGLIVGCRDEDLPEATIHEEKEHHPHPNAGHLVPVNTTTENEVNPDGSWQNNHTQASQRNGIRWRKKRIWIPVATVLLIAIILGATLGGLRSPPGQTDDASSATVSSGPTEATSMSPVATTGTSARLNSSLAAVAWTDNDRTNQRRLYYQTSAGMVKESAWNSSAGEWYSSDEAIAIARPNSPLAAAVAGPKSRPFQLNLYYLAPDGHLVELFTNTEQSQVWKNSSISDNLIVPSPSSALAPIWSSYDELPDNSPETHTLLIAYKDSGEQLKVVNVTTSGFRYTTLVADSLADSGLAINLIWTRNGPPELRVYYQKDDDRLVMAQWIKLRDTDGECLCARETIFTKKRLLGSKVWDWKNENIGRVPSGGPMASFSWGVNQKAGRPLLIHILTSGPEGVDVHWYNGNTSSWQDRQQPKAFQNIEPYSPLAANGDRHVYALEAGSVREFVVSEDGLTWSLVGNVPTNNS